MTPDELRAWMEWIPHDRSTWPWRIGRLQRDAGTLPKGTLVKIVMVSRFGDVGITDNLQAECGYKVRVDLDDLCKEER